MLPRADKFDGSAERRLPANDPRDLTPGDHDVPPFHFGGQDMYAISPDGQEVASEEYVTLLHERHVR